MLKCSCDDFWNSILEPRTGQSKDQRLEVHQGAEMLSAPIQNEKDSVVRMSESIRRYIRAAIPL